MILRVIAASVEALLEFFRLNTIFQEMNRSNELVPKHLLLLKLFLLSVGVVLALIVSEVFLRQMGVVELPVGIPHTSSVGKFPYSPEGSFIVRYNGEGNRSEEVSPTKESHERRIVVVGDSHAFGVGVSQPDLVQNKLAGNLQLKNPSLRVRGLNVARLGSAPRRYLELLNAFSSYEPDLVTIIIFSGNDLFGHLVNPISTKPIEASEVYTPSDAKPLGAKAKGLIRRLHLYHLLRQRLRLGPSDVPAEVDMAQFGPFVQGLRQAQYYLEHQDKFESSLDLLRDGLVEIREYLAPGTKVLVSVLPSKIVGEGGEFDQYWSGEAASLGITEEDVLSMDRKIHDGIVKVVEGVFKYHLDLAPVLRDTTPGAPKYWPQDSHLNTLGHALIADALAEYIHEHKLIS